MRLYGLCRAVTSRFRRHPRPYPPLVRPDPARTAAFRLHTLVLAKGVLGDHRDVCSWGQSGPHFRAPGCLLVAKSRSQRVTPAGRLCGGPGLTGRDPWRGQAGARVRAHGPRRDRARLGVARRPSIFPEVSWFTAPRGRGHPARRRRAKASEHGKILCKYLIFMREYWISQPRAYESLTQRRA